MRASFRLAREGETHGLDERRWLTQKKKSPTYVHIYGQKMSFISADKYGRLFGVIIEDEGIVSTQKTIFDLLWESLAVLPEDGLTTG